MTSPSDAGPLSADEQHDLLSLLHDIVTGENNRIDDFEREQYERLTAGLRYTRQWSRD